ncbi:MAG: hypothetical protein LLG93_07635 [Deltaproteobacteria bacterium]|nr:hypothetical protein [Deltaproteobacteria bacterium]
MGTPLINPGGFDAMPGITEAVYGSSRTFLADNSHLATEGAIVVSDSVDDEQPAGSQHKLRGGKVLVRVEAGPDLGKFVDLNHASAPLDADIRKVGILYGDVNMLKGDGTTNKENKQARVVVHGFVVDASLLWGAGVAPARKTACRNIAKLIDFKL